MAKSRLIGPLGGGGGGGGTVDTTARGQANAAQNAANKLKESDVVSAVVDATVPGSEKLILTHSDGSTMDVDVSALAGGGTAAATSFDNLTTALLGDPTNVQGAIEALDAAVDALTSAFEADRRFDELINANTVVNVTKVSGSYGTYGVSMLAPGLTVSLDPAIPDGTEIEIANVSGGSGFVTGGTIDGDPTGIELNGNGNVTLEKVGGVWVLVEAASAATGGAGGGSTYTASGGLNLVGSVIQEIPYQNLPLA